MQMSWDGGWGGPMEGEEGLTDAGAEGRAGGLRPGE